MDNIEFIVPSKKQVIGSERLEVLEIMGSGCVCTQFNALLDNKYYKGECKYCLSDIASRNGFSKYTVVDSSGEISSDEISFCIRPMFKYENLNFTSNRKVNSKGVIEVEFGEFPQVIVDKKTNAKLEEKYEECGKRTSKQYHFTNMMEEAVVCDEYIIDGKKYVRFSNESKRKISLPLDLSRYESDAYWVEVLPIKWLVDEKERVLISKYGLLPYYKLHGLKFKDFKDSGVYKYLNGQFKKEIRRLENHELEKSSANSKSYKFDYKEVNEEEILKGSIDANIPVFLHGLTGVGKTSRVKAIDPDYELVLMENATLDSLIGKSVYNADTGEMKDIPPTWYQNICRKCKEEPDKVHIVFFDELTNALPSIQGKASTIISERKIESKWELPENVRIVAAGNDCDESLSANELSVQLFSRFAHIYIKDDVDKWLSWAADNNIHPAIYSYMAYKSYMGNSVLRTEYTGETPNADPRRWEMASNVLKVTQQPEMLRAYLGEELTRDFIEFSKIPVITVEDVLMHNYTEEDLEMSTSRMFTTALGLSSVDEENFEEVRNFMLKINPEATAAFEVMWAHGEEQRLLKIAEVQLKDRMIDGGLCLCKKKN